jgi:hypothetical protein
MDYPTSVDVRTPAVQIRWKTLVQWFLAIPHFIIAGAMSYVSGAIVVVSWFVILFTGNLPVGLANFQILVLRYTLRTQLYAGFLCDDYPPFTFAMTSEDPGDHSVQVTVTPATENRNRLTVGFRIILAIPAALYVMLIGLIGAVCWIAGFFAVIVTGAWPPSLRAWVMSAQRVGLRFNAYAYLLTDQYPPFTTA